MSLNNEIILEDSAIQIEGKQFLFHQKNNQTVCAHVYKNTVRYFIFKIKDSLLYLSKIEQLKPGNVLDQLIFDRTHSKKGYKSVHSFLTSVQLSDLHIKEQKHGHYQYQLLSYKDGFFQSKRFYLYNLKDTTTEPPPLIHIPETPSLGKCLYLDIHNNKLLVKNTNND